MNPPTVFSYSIVKLIISIWIIWLKPTVVTTPASPIPFSIQLPEGERFAAARRHRQAVAVSPDSQWLAFVSYKPGEADHPNGPPGGPPAQLYANALRLSLCALPTALHVEDREARG